MVDRTLVKIINEHYESCHGGRFRWLDFLPLPSGEPGPWTPVFERVVPCKQGWHATDLGHMLEWVADYGPERPRGYICEVQDAIEHTDDIWKVVAKSLRLVRRLTPDEWQRAWSTERDGRVLLSAAMRSIPAHTFEGRAHRVFVRAVCAVARLVLVPDDDRPRLTIEAAERWADGCVSLEEVDRRGKDISRAILTERVSPDLHRIFSIAYLVTAIAACTCRVRTYGDRKEILLFSKKLPQDVANLLGQRTILAAANAGTNLTHEMFQSSNDDALLRCADAVRSVIPRCPFGGVEP